MQRPSMTMTARISIVLSAVVLAATVAAANPFPRYDVIEPNVAFWTGIYATYTTRQAVIHDARNLNIIYDVIELRPQTEPGARKVNRRRMKRAKARFRHILKQLAADPGRRTGECPRVATLFGNPADGAVYARAARQVRSQIGQRDRFWAGLIRSGAYIEEIQSIFRSYGLPEELSYLPHVESSFNINAYSKFGAAGMWQFTRSTGKRYMKVGYEVDERRDPIRATHAAARLLRDNFDKLRSWPLAITAYNHGATGMLRAKKRHGDYATIVQKYRGRTFKFASRNFYSEFLAALDVATDYRAHFGDVELERPRPSKTVELTAYVSLDDVCAHFNVARQTIRSLNPALREPVFQGQKYIPKGYHLRLPVSTDVAAAIPRRLHKNKQKPSYFYTVQRGDTAGRIARMHGVRLSDLILANNLNRRATIYPKQTLRIPHGGKTDRGPKHPVVAAARLTPDVKQETAAAQSTPKPAQDPVSYPQPVLASVLPIPSTDTLKELARTVTDNGPDRPSSEVVTADVGFESIEADDGLQTGLIRVEVEETLGHYAEWADVRTQRIRRLNDLRFGNPLHLHQKLRIPLNRVSARVFEQQRYEFHKRLQEDFFATYTVSATEPYRVKRGDNFWTLCRQRFDIPMWLLSNYNPEVDFADLRMNQKLRIPSVDLRLSGTMDPVAPY